MSHAVATVSAAYTAAQQAQSRGFGPCAVGQARRSRPGLPRRPRPHTRTADGRSAAARRATALTEHGLMLPTAFGNPSDPNTFSHVFSRLGQEGGPRPLAPARASPLRRIAHARPGHPSPHRLRSPRPRQHRDHQGLLRTSSGGRPPRPRPFPVLSRGNSPQWLPRCLPKTPKTSVEGRKAESP